MARSANNQAETGMKTLNKMVAILESFSALKPTWSLADLTIHLNVPKSSLHRYLLGLEQLGILRRGQDKLWRLGYRLFIWGTLVPELTSLKYIGDQHLQDLVKLTNESAILTIYDKHEVICIDKYESSHSVRLTLTVGSRRMPHAGASSKILMAHLPAEEIQTIIDEKGLPKLSSNTITNPDKLKRELKRIRQDGYASSHEETDTGAWGVATPIFDIKGEVIAGIGIAGPTSRFSDSLQKKYVKLCCDASEEITKTLKGESSSDILAQW